MDHGDEIRRKASELRAEVCSAAGNDPDTLFKSETIADLALDRLGLTCISEHPESANLHSSLAVLEDDNVFINNELEGGYRHYCVAHEAGHHILHTFKPACAGEDIREVEAEGELSSARSKVVGYGPRELAEREANLFALELLLPCAALRKAFAEDGLSAEEIASQTEMPLSYVKRQLARALLIPVETGDKKESDEQPEFSLNESQVRAVETKDCPVLISAGPGTGKTETLIRRIVHLLNEGANPQRILALTFSNKATNEMRERIAEARPEDAAKIPIMTFHSFGFNLLMKYGHEAGIDKDWRLLDQIDSLLMLEGHLKHLELEHYMALYDPMRDLPDVLTAISKAKDELCGPELYMEHAEAMLKTAGEDEAEITKAEKALETARVYTYYQRLMDEEKHLDFGDLIFRPVRLLQENGAVRKTVAGSFDHVLVDEFQDVNRASGVLLRLVAGDGKGLWAVGDLRQSIYRWRGASPQNIRLFHEEYPGARTLSLETNYRSVEQIVRTFGEFGEQMIAREPFNEWEAFRGKAEGEPVTYDVADRFETEAEAIAEHVSSAVEGGIAFKDQAVICRTHAQLAGVGEALTASGVPVFYLGQLFERDEVRDMLSFLDLASSGNCHSVLRVGEFPDYALELSDLFAIVICGEDKQIPLREVDADDPALQLSNKGRDAVKKLQEHLAHDAKASAYTLLSDYLFTRSGYLRDLLSAGSVADKQKLIAIYQLLGFAGAMESRFAESDNPIAEFLKYIKRLVLFREQKNLAEIPAAASGLDAVRLLTVHGAKGLEFGAVHLPYLAAGKFPGRYRGEKCPTPPGLRSDPKEDHMEEEECLFFVAASRARDRLHLSRSINYSERSQSRESPFLGAIENVLPKERVIKSQAEKARPEPIPPEAYTRTEFYAAELDRYIDCGKQYYYRFEAGLKTSDSRSAYQKLHGVVFETLRQVQNAGDSAGDIGAFAKETMERLWQAEDLDSHPYADLYRDKAAMLLDRVIERFGSPEGKMTRKTIPVPLSNGVVKVSSDAIEESGEGTSRKVVARSVKTGKQPKTVETANSDAILLKALKDEYPDADVSVAKVYLTDDSEFVHDISERVIANRMAKYEDAIDGINRAEFDPNPSDFRCPTCAYYFMCQRSGG